VSVSSIFLCASHDQRIRTVVKKTCPGERSTQMIKTVIEKAMRVGSGTPLPGAIYRQMRDGRPAPAPTATRGMPIRGDLRRRDLRRRDLRRRDLRRSTRMMPDLRGVILLCVVSVLASLAVTASALAATSFFSNPIKIPGGRAARAQRVPSRQRSPSAA